jgi:hypothetical protein
VAKSKAEAKSAAAASTLVTFLLDKSGSMGPIRDDTIGAFNTYLGELQQAPAGILFSFLQFDSNSVDVIHRNIPVSQAAPLDASTYVPGASTPLIDAAYKTIKAVEEALGKRDDKPRVVVCIQTDGHENASVEYGWGDLTALIKQKTALGWQFSFLGCGIDAYDQGARMGISAMNTMSYDRRSPETQRAAFAASGQNTVLFARGEVASTAYDAAQRKAAGDRFTPDSLKPPVSKPPSGAKAPRGARSPGQPSASAMRKPLVDDISLS